MNAPLPYRQVSRLAGEMHLAIGHAVHEHLTTGRERGGVALLLARLGAADWTAGGTIATPAVRTRFGSINALSRSLGRPFETVRRHVRALVAEGVATVDARGVALSDDAAQAGRIVAFHVAAHDLLLRFAEELAMRGQLPPVRDATAAPTPGTILAVALDIALLPFESLRGAFDDWTAMTLWSGIAAANVRHIILDPVLDARYADRYVDDAERRPIALAAVAQAMRIPYATAWRHAAQLERDGRIARARGGLIVATDHYRATGVGDGMSASTHYYLRRLGELVAQGLDPLRAEEAYLAGRPPLRPFG